MSDDDFKPQLGRLRSQGSARDRSYLGQLVAASTRSGAGRARNARFDGSRIGRGAAIGRLLGSRDRHAGLRARRVVVKTRLVRLGSKAGAGAAHLRYIQRDGVTREGSPGELYGRDADGVDGKAFLERCDGDRHQFRFIVSVEDAVDYDDLQPFVRRFMTQIEEDLGTRLDWVAVDHFNTGHAHSHIMLRGVDDQGQNLVIAREYIAHGMRTRASDLATLDLGPRTDQEIERHLRLDIDAERLTAIDRKLIGDRDAARAVSASSRDPFEQMLRAGRLQKLARMGLAEEVGAGRWHLTEGLEETLRDMGERGDIVRTMQREFSARNRPLADYVIERPSTAEMPVLIGRVARRGLSDELHDRHFLIIDALDGKTHYVDIGLGDATEPTAEGAIVRVSPRSLGARPVDRTIADVAAAHDGRYSVSLHLAFDRNASQDFAETHVRRLEAMRRATAGVERDPDGTWRIAPDHIARAAAFESGRARDRPVTVDIVSTLPLEKLARFDGATWLDHRLVAASDEPSQNAGFGGEVRHAEEQRRRWLVTRELASEREDATIFPVDLIATLRRRELLRVADQLSVDLDKTFVETAHGARIDGRLVRRVALVSGNFALVEKSREFTLVPWRPVLERQIGNQVSGIVHGEVVNWSIGRSRGGPAM